MLRVFKKKKKLRRFIGLVSLVCTGPAQYVGVRTRIAVATDQGQTSLELIQRQGMWVGW